MSPFKHEIAAGRNMDVGDFVNRKRNVKSLNKECNAMRVNRLWSEASEMFNNRVTSLSCFGLLTQKQ